MPMVSRVIPATQAAEAYRLLDSPPAELMQVILSFDEFSRRGQGVVPRSGRRGVSRGSGGSSPSENGYRVSHILRLSAQEQYLRGATAVERWEHASSLGFDALELRAAGEGRFAARLPELKLAAAAGVPMPTVCVEMLHFVGDFDPDKRADALVQMKSQLSVMAEIGGRLAMTPASYGMFSRRLPPFTSPRTEEEDTQI